MKINKFILLVLGCLFFIACSQTEGIEGVENVSESGGYFSLINIFFYLILLIILVLFGLFLPVAGVWFKAFSTHLVLWPYTLWMMKIRRTDLPFVIDTLIKAQSAGVDISLEEIEDLYLSDADVDKIINAVIIAQNGGAPISLNELKQHALSGGNVMSIVNAMVSAAGADMGNEEKYKMHLDYVTAASIDKAGFDLDRLIQRSISSEVHETGKITAVSDDGIEITARCRVTVRIDLHRVIPGADIETVLARINEALVSVIGKEKCQEVLADPYIVADKVEKQEHLFDDTMYRVMSIDISEVRMGKNLHAEHEKEKAEAKKAMEEAREIEMRALMSEAKVLRIKAESEVQKAMAAAFLDGNINVQDYLSMKNKEADTEMRKSYSRNPDSDSKEFD